MITILKQQCVGTNGGYIEAIGLSTDTKPSKIGSLNVTNGSAILEMDTGDLRLYDEAGQTWIKQNRGGGGSLPIHICVEGEYDESTGVPTISSPDEGTLYLVPASSATTGDLFDEWVYVDSAWEKVGSANLVIPQSDWAQTNTEATDYIKNKPAIKAGTGTSSILETGASAANGDYSHAEGYYTTASGTHSHAEGGGTRAIGNESHAEGGSTTASGDYSHAEGTNTTASGSQSHAEGSGTTASGSQSHAEGSGTKAYWSCDHAEGNTCEAGTSTGSGQPGNHAEGYGTKATGGASHAEGSSTTASGPQSHAEGSSTTASGPQSHAEGGGTTASGSQSHAEGGGTTASGVQSHAEGASTIASGSQQHVFGRFNIDDVSDATPPVALNTYVEIVGNGTKNDARSNARTLDWSGNEWLAGNLTAAGGSITIGSTTITEAQLQALLALLN